MSWNPCTEGGRVMGALRPRRHRRTDHDANVAAGMLRTVAPDYLGLAEFFDDNGP
jgi:hypothetical protein